MKNPYPNGYESLTAAAYGPGYTTSQGASVSFGYRIELQATDGPDLDNDTLGEIYTTGDTLAEAARNMAQMLYNFTYRGELIIADETHRTDYIVFDLSKTADHANVKWWAIEHAFGPAQRTVAGYATDIAMPGQNSECECCGEPPETTTAAMTASDANAEARADRLREKVRKQQQEFKNTDVFIDSYNSDPKTYRRATFEQSQATLNLMADWLEDLGGLTTHLAGSIVRSLHGELSDPGSTYRQISEVGHRPLEDVSIIEVEDAENDMDLVIEVRKPNRH